MAHVALVVHRRVASPDERAARITSRLQVEVPLDRAEVAAVRARPAAELAANGIGPPCKTMQI